MKEICVLCFLGWNTWTDINERKVSLLSILLAVIGGIFFHMWKKDPIWSIALAALIGFVFCFLSVITQGALGMGDGLTILTLGIWIGAQQLIFTVFFALFTSAVWSGILLVFFRKGRKTEIPFVPFLMSGYLGGVLLWEIL